MTRKGILRSSLILLIACVALLVQLVSYTSHAGPALAQSNSSCKADRHDIQVVKKLTVSDGSLSATLKNISNECDRVGVATYKVYDSQLKDQYLYDYQLANLSPGQTMTLSAALPVCRWQADAFVGDVLQPPHYDGNFLDGLVSSDKHFCVPTPYPCGSLSSNPSNFNGTPIAEGDYIWFNSVIQVQGIGQKPVSISFDKSTIQFTANGHNYTLDVPSAVVNINPAVQLAQTSFDNPHTTWITTVQPGLSGNTWLGGLTFKVPSGGFSGGVNPVTWYGHFSTDTPGIKIQWQWGAAVYTQFSSHYNLLGVKPVDDNKGSKYQNSDHAGTPENFKPYVIGGARGGGGSNWTGSYSGTVSCQS